MSTILVVDDDATNRLLARSVLERQYVVLEASSAAEALRVLETQAADLVLLDVMMPGQSGVDVCPTIKERFGKPFLPVLMLTALSEPNERVAGLAAGADDFITKPFDARELRLRVASFLRVRDQDRVSREQLRALHDLDHLKDDLVSLLVHDLRNPLSAMVAVLEVAQQSPRPEDFATLHRVAERMRGLVDDLLTVRQLEDNGLQLEVKQVRVHDVLRAAADTAAPAAGLREVRIVVDVVDVVARIDAPLVQRAVENLLYNAARYAPKGCEVILKGSLLTNELVVTVSDRGPGIHPEVRPHLFEKFGALAARARRGPAGHGLGLHLVRLVAEAHGGSVHADDRPGGGTVITLRLPAGPA